MFLIYIFEYSFLIFSYYSSFTFVSCIHAFISDVKEIKTIKQKYFETYNDELFVSLIFRKKENGLSGTWFDFVKKVEIEIKNYEKFVN